jgi:hypothetical protein
MPVIDFLPPASRRSHGRSLSPWRDRSQHQPPKQVYGRVAAGPQKVSGTKMVRKTKEFGRDSKKPTFPSSSPLTPATESGSRRAEMDASFPDIGAHWKPSPGYRVSCAGRVCRGCYHRGETISSRQRAVLTVDHMAREIRLTSCPCVRVSCRRASLRHASQRQSVPAFWRIGDENGGRIVAAFPHFA